MGSDEGMDYLSVLSKEKYGCNGDEDRSHRADNSINEERQGFHGSRVRDQEGDEEQMVSLHQRDDALRCTEMKNQPKEGMLIRMNRSYRGFVPAWCLLRWPGFVG